MYLYDLCLMINWKQTVTNFAADYPEKCGTCGSSKKCLKIQAKKTGELSYEEPDYYCVTVKEELAPGQFVKLFY